MLIGEQVDTGHGPIDVVVLAKATTTAADAEDRTAKHPINSGRLDAGARTLWHDAA